MSAILTAADSAAILARSTVYPWIVELRLLRPDGSRATRISVDWRGATAGPPVPEEMVGDDEHFAGSDIFPAERFIAMPDFNRARYAAHYRAWRMACIARDCNKPVEQLEPWRDYDAVHVDEQVQRWLSAGRVRYAGD